MALKNVADTPLIANANASLARLGAYLKKVPVSVWRMVVIGLALFWICHTLASVFWLIVPEPELPPAPVTPSVAAVDGGSSAGRNIDVAAVQALNLFGDYNARPVATAPVAVVEPRRKLTDLNLDLQGVIASDDPSRSWAIIGTSNTQQLYRIGEGIAGVSGVKLAEIHDFKVVLNNNGSMEELWLYGEDGSEVAVSAPGYSPPAAEPSAPVQTATVRPEQLQQARNIGDVVRFMVATENGRMIGYKVRPGRKRELFDQVGLQTDDIVVSVNGIEVNEPQKVREVYQALKTATEANLQVMRDGSTQSITITMSSEG